MNDTIQNSSPYLYASHFHKSFVKYKHNFSIINANIRDMATDLDKLKLFIDDLEYTFQLLELRKPGRKHIM